MSTARLTLVRSRDASGERKQMPSDAKALHEEITKATVDRLAKLPQTGKDVFVPDTELPGFRLRRTPNGTVLFMFTGRIKGGEGANKNKLVTRSIGRAHGKGAITVAKARAEAVALREALARGINPEDERRAAAEAAEAAQRERERQATVREWTPAYALTHMLEWRASRPDPAMHLKPETIEFYQRGIGYLGRLSSVPIVDIRADDIRQALDKIEGKAKPAKAKRALSGVIAHTIKRLDLNIPNPVGRLDRGEFKAPPPRTSYIKENDLAEFVRKVTSLKIEGKPRETKRASDYVLLTLLYGTRKEELMRMRWDWINWSEGVITIPASITKQKRTHYLPLTNWTKGILEARRDEQKRDSAYVFPGEKCGQLDPTTKQPIDQPLTNIRKSLGRAVGEGLKLHDLRRTLITHCSGLGIHGSRLKAIVGHSRSGVTENYDQREIEQVRRDLTTYHDWLLELVERRRFEQHVQEHPEEWPEPETEPEVPTYRPGVRR